MCSSAEAFHKIEPRETARHLIRASQELIRANQQTIRASKNGFITKSASKQLIEGHMIFFKQMPTEVETLINHPVGFDKAAIDQLKKHWQLAN